MAEEKNIFDEILRIEKQADELLAQARARVGERRHAADRRIAELDTETDRRIESTGAALAAEQNEETQRAVLGINEQFEKDKAALDAVQSGRSAELIDWAVSRIRELER